MNKFNKKCTRGRKIIIEKSQNFHGGELYHT